MNSFFTLVVVNNRMISSSIRRLTKSAVRYASNYPAGHLGSVDGGFEKDRIHKGPGDPSKRDFTYFVLGGARFIYASTARLALIKFVSRYSFSHTLFLINY